MTWYRLTDGSMVWKVIEPFYCWCCRRRGEPEKKEHCYCSRHIDPQSGDVCDGCMKHDVEVVPITETLLNGDTLTRRVKQHVCRFS